MAPRTSPIAPPLRRQAPTPRSTGTPGQAALARARRGMLVASVAASVAGLVIGGRYGAGQAVAGLFLGLGAAAAAVFLLNAALLGLSRVLGRNPAEIQNGIAALAAWLVAAAAAAVAAGAILRLY